MTFPLIVRPRDAARLGGRLLHLIGRAAVTILSLVVIIPAAVVQGARRPWSTPRGPGPEAVGERFFAAMQAADWHRVSRLVHPDALARVRRTVAPLAAAESPDAAGEVLPMLLVSSASDLARLSDVELFERLLAHRATRAPSLTDLLAGLEVIALGHVPGGAELAHVVVCTRARGLGGETYENLSVMSVRRYGSGWRVELSGAIEGLTLGPLRDSTA
jgi:hypothetical protein